MAGTGDESKRGEAAACHDTPADKMKMMGVVCLLSCLTDAKDTGPGSAKWGPKLPTTYCWMAGTRQSGLTSFSRHSFCIAVMGLLPWGTQTHTNIRVLSAEKDVEAWGV